MIESGYELWGDKVFWMASREFIQYNIRPLRWWKILAFLALTGGLVAINMGNERENTFFIIEVYFTKIVCDFIKPNLYKLKYLLPGDIESRATYLKYITFDLFLFILIWYGVIYLIAVSFGELSFWIAVKRIFSVDLFIAFFNILSTMPVYSLAKANSQKSKRAEIIMLVMILTLIYPVVHIILTISVLEGKWYVLSTIVAYLCMIPPIISIMIYINHANLDYESTENYQKEKKKFVSA